MSTFTWIPDNNFSNDPIVSTTEAKFGDGYTQRGSFGINTIQDKFSLSFNNRSYAEGNAILAFLKLNAGVTSFEWTPPNETTSKKFICKTWKDTYPKYNLINISATFEQVF